MDVIKKVDEYINKYKDDMLSKIARIISIQSVYSSPKEGMPFGEETAHALNEALKIAEELGFETKNLDNYAGYAQIGEGEKLIGIVGHLDVVPSGEGWDSDPFKLTEKDGVLYARGITDDKGPIMTAMYAAKIVKDMGIKLNKRIRIVFGTNEESGFACIKHYKQVEEDFDCGFTPDANFPLVFGEKGNYTACFSGKINSEKDKTSIVSIEGGDAKNAVCRKCTVKMKSSLDINEIKDGSEKYARENSLKCEFNTDGCIITLTFIGKAAHASLPELGINAASHMMAYLKMLMPNSPFITGYNNVISTQSNGQLAGVSYSDEYGPLTLNIGTITSDEYTAGATIDIRYPVTTSDFTPYAKKLVEVFLKNNLQIDGYTIGKPLFFDPNSKLVRTLCDAYTSVTKDTVNKPITIGGGTYAKAFDNIVAFGPEYPEYEHDIHTANEKMPTEYLINALRVYVKAIISLLEI